MSIQINRFSAWHRDRIDKSNLNIIDHTTDEIIAYIHSEHLDEKDAKKVAEKFIEVFEELIINEEIKYK